MPFDGTQVRYGRLRSGLGEERAYRAGLFGMAAIYRHPRAAMQCEKLGIPIVRAAGETLNPTGGVLVPSEMLRGIVAVREATGAVRQAAQVVPMAGDVATSPRRTGGLTVYFPTEGLAPTESQVALDDIRLVAQKMAAMVRSSSELAEDALIDFGDFLTTEFGYAFAVKEDEIGFNGDGGPSYGGMVGICPTLLSGSHDAGKVVAASGHDTYAEIDVSDIAKLIAACPAVAIPGAKWFCSALAYALVFCRLAATAGGLVAANVNGRIQASYLGWPVTFTQALPNVATTLSGQVMLAFGDMSLSTMLGERRGVTVRSSAEKYFDTDQVAYLANERVHINNHSLGDNTTAGPIVGLVGA